MVQFATEEAKLDFKLCLWSVRKQSSCNSGAMFSSRHCISGSTALVGVLLHEVKDSVSSLCTCTAVSAVL